MEVTRMDVKLKKELDKLIKIGKDRGELSTRTILQLLYDINMYTDAVSYTHLTLPTNSRV